LENGRLTTTIPGEGLALTNLATVASELGDLASAPSCTVNSGDPR
jgi:hypothetical protein